jgi:hypothetical protein
MMATLDQRVLDLIRARRVVKANDLAFWTGCDPVPSINRLERTGHIEHAGPGEPHQHWRAVDVMGGI